MSAPDAVAVVIPARDEEEHLPAAIAAVAAAVIELPPQVDVQLTVVLDRCTDRTPDVAARALRRFLASTAAGRHRAPDACVLDRCGADGGAVTVGAARAAGVARAASRLDHEPSRVWVACTDADSVVPAGWLGLHLGVAAVGVEALAGSVVVVDWAPWADAVAASWDEGYHRHGRPAPVHGANLGVRLDAYLAVGGFGAHADGEDQDLFDRVRAAGRPTAVTTAMSVATSSRRTGRAPAGFSGYLRDLEARTGNPA